MIRIPFEEVVKRVAEKSGLAKEEILKKIDEKCTQLSGLISKDGAAHIVANELGVQLIQHGGRIKIKDVFPGMRSVEIAAKVTQKFDLREFTRQDGSTGKLLAFNIGDETGSIRVVAWGDKADEAVSIQENGLILIQQGQVRENNRGYKEIHLGDKASVVMNPPGITIGEVQAVQARPKATRKGIKELAENDNNVEIVGTVVQVFDPKFFEVCSQCGKRAKPDESGKAICPEHGAGLPAWSCVGNVYLDDGSENIRVVFFRNQLEHLSKKSQEQLLEYRDAPERFEDVKTELLGQMVKVTGRVSRNQFFDHLEFVAQLVEGADPNEELKRLQATQ